LVFQTYIEPYAGGLVDGKNVYRLEDLKRSFSEFFIPTTGQLVMMAIKQEIVF